MSYSHQGDQRFNLSLWALLRQPLVLFFCLATLIIGSFAFFQLGQSEDPPFTFKVMVLRSYWPGASARDVELQLTDKLEKKLQEVPYLDWVRSYSKPGESFIFIAIKDSAPPERVGETWYQVRKKIGDIRYTLPAGVNGPFFNDEFGDTYMHIFALSGKGIDMATIKEYAERVRSDFLRLSGVAKVDLLGVQDQKIYVEISNTRLATLGLSPAQILESIKQHLALPPQAIYEQYEERVVIRLEAMDSWKEIEQLTFLSDDGRHTVKLKDIATIRRGYENPPSWTMRFQGEPVIGLGIVMLPGYNVINLGRDLEKEQQYVRKQLPIGMALDTVTSMSRAVKRSIDEFIDSLMEAIAIVLAVSLVSLGIRTGMIVMISIPIVLAATFALMDAFQIGLHKISLGALILSLGLLVDDAIIAVESMAVKIEQGWDRLKAAGFAYQSTAFPMLTGTLITVTGFLPIATAKSATGEYTRSIFQVTAIALIVSWVVAVIVIPYLGYYLIPSHQSKKSIWLQMWKFWRWLWAQPVSDHLLEGEDRSAPVTELYQTPFYQNVRKYVGLCVKYRKTTLMLTSLVFGLSVVVFSLVPQQFFPDSNRPELLVDLKLADGASYQATEAVVLRFEHWLKRQSGIENEVCYVGNGSPRFYLPLDQQLPSPNFAQCVLLTHGKTDRERLRIAIDRELKRDFHSLRGRISRLENGPPVGFPVQFRVSGRDVDQARNLANQVADKLRTSPLVRNVQLDWDEPMKAVHIVLDRVALQRLGLTPEYLGQYIQAAFQGLSITPWREGIEMPDVVIRAPAEERIHIEKLPYLMIPLPNGQRVSLKSVAEIKPALEEAVIWRRNRLSTFTVRADVIDGVQGADVAKAMDRQMESLRHDLPLGYRIEVGGVIEDSTKGRDSIVAGFPLMITIVMGLLMLQLNRFSRMFMVLITAPLGLIGATLALLVFRMPFGFVAMLGVIALSGIVMRNTVILVDQIDHDVEAGEPLLKAIVEATVRRFRPICLTALAAVLGLIPLSESDFFGPMAVAMMGGIIMATILTVMVVPALYAVVTGRHHANPA